MMILSDHLFRGQAVGLLASCLIPWIGNALYLGGFVLPDLDLTVIAFTVSGLILLWTISRRRLLELIPLAREVARDDFFETMSDAIIVVDARDRLLDWNPAAQTILHGEASDVIGRPLAQVHPALADAVASAAPAGGEEFSTEFDRWEDNVFYSYDVRVTVLRRGHGLLTGRLISLRDVTEQRRREQQVEVLNRILRHNFRNELNIVHGNATLLTEGLVDADADLYQRAATIEATADRMITRVEKVKRIAQRSDGGAHEPVNIGEELADLVAAKRREHLEARITTDCPEQAWVAAGPAVTTALDEVVTNALKHQDGETHHDGEPPTAHISVATGEWNDQKRAQIRVTDTGPGIPAQEVHPILEGRETPLAHSTGIGLWLVMWIVREVGGDVKFPETDDGTTVTIHLPRGAPPDGTSGG